jgi:hypothetical protein
VRHRADDLPVTADEEQRQDDERGRAGHAGCGLTGWPPQGGLPNMIRL